MLPVDELRSIEAAIPTVHEKLYLGLKKTVRLLGCLVFLFSADDCDVALLCSAALGE